MPSEMSTGVKGFPPPYSEHIVSEILRNVQREEAIIIDEASQDIATTLSLESTLRLDEPKDTPSAYWETSNKISFLQRNFKFLEPAQISTFLFQNDFLLDIIEESYDTIREVFGNYPQLYLDIYEDPEEDAEELFIIIERVHPPEESLKLLNLLDETWFLDVIDQTRGKLNITVESM